MAALPGFLTRNWPFKLAALALSIILWLFVAAEETTSQLVVVDVEVEVAPALALARPAPTLRALVTGPGRELIKLYASPPKLRIMVPANATTPMWRTTVSPSDLQVPRSTRVSIQDVEPRTLEFELDRMLRRDVPVAVRGTIEAESGFALTRPLTIAPATAQVEGPRALVQALDSIATDPVEIRGLTGPFERKVPLDTAHLPLLRVSPHEVIVSGSARRS